MKYKYYYNSGNTAVNPIDILGSSLAKRLLECEKYDNESMDFYTSIIGFAQDNGNRIPREERLKMISHCIDNFLESHKENEDEENYNRTVSTLKDLANEVNKNKDMTEKLYTDDVPHLTPNDWITKENPEESKELMKDSEDNLFMCSLNNLNEDIHDSIDDLIQFLNDYKDSLQKSHDANVKSMFNGNDYYRISQDLNASLLDYAKSIINTTNISITMERYKFHNIVMDVLLKAVMHDTAFCQNLTDGQSILLQEKLYQLALYGKTLKTITVKDIINTNIK